MVKNVLRTKIGSSVAVATVVTMASMVGVASAHHSFFKLADDRQNLIGYYTKDQCKNGGWKMFKDASGHQLFKNQGQCVAFFASGGKVNGGHGHGDGDNDGDDQGHNQHGNGGNNGHHHWWDALAASFWNWNHNSHH
jgi:hypothetical protein